MKTGHAALKPAAAGLDEVAHLVDEDQAATNPTANFQPQISA